MGGSPAHLGLGESLMASLPEVCINLLFRLLPQGTKESLGL